METFLGLLVLSAIAYAVRSAWRNAGSRPAAPPTTSQLNRPPTPPFRESNDDALATGFILGHQFGGGRDRGDAAAFADTDRSVAYDEGYDTGFVDGGDGDAGDGW